MKAIWEEQIEIKNYEVGPDSNLKLNSLFNYLQEAAGNHAEDLGWGYQEMFSKGYFWVLSRMQVEIIRMPQWGEKLKIETWPSGIERLFAKRDFNLTDEAGKLVCKAVSGWLILDTVKHRVVNPIFIKDDYPDPNRISNITLDTGKLHAFDNLINTYQRNVSYNELDVNDHVNNARYLEWILDAYESDFLKNNLPKSILISYINEAKYPNSIDIELHTASQNKKQHSIIASNTENGKKILQAIIEWEGK